MSKIRIHKSHDGVSQDSWNNRTSDIDIVGQNNILLQKDGHIMLYLM